MDHIFPALHFSFQFFFVLWLVVLAYSTIIENPFAIVSLVSLNSDSVSFAWLVSSINVAILSSFSMTVDTYWIFVIILQVILRLAPQANRNGRRIN